MEEVVRLPLLDDILPGGLRYGANYLVEFEPQSLWFETSLTLCAQALREGIRTDYHTFTHPSPDIRRHLSLIVPDLAKLEDDETFRIVDSYSVQTGMGAAERVGKSETVEWVDVKSVKIEDWDKGSVSTLKSQVPTVDRRRFHIDDDTSVLLRFNDEERVTEHFRTMTVPFARHLELAAIHSIASGIYSDGFYKKFESFCDGLWDFKVREKGDQIEQYMRLRFVRGASHDSDWKRIELVRNGEVSMSREGGRDSIVETAGKPAENPTVSYIAGHDEVDLSKYTVVGSYLRFDETVRNLLKDLRQKIVSSFESPANKHENILLWAPPGTGKTHLVRQIASSLEGAVRFSEVNLAEVGEGEFRSRISENIESDRPTLCFIDEFDSKANETWPIENLLASLDADSMGPRRVYVMAGSLGNSLRDMKERLSGRSKGPDLLSRIPQGNEYSVPTMSDLDHVLVFLASFTKEAPRIGKHVYEVEKFGLYYVSKSSQLANARRMREFSIRCADRVPRGESRLKYDNMFDAGDPANKEFWARESSMVPQLLNSFMRVESPEPMEEIEGERRLAAIMFTDIVGFTATTQRDEGLAMTLLSEQRALMRPIFAKFRGREVKTIGDAFLVEFASALEGVKCAVEIQEALKVNNVRRPEDRKILVRIGIHLGDVLHTGTDVAGDAVNVASRLEPLAPPGGVCVSGQVYESVANKVQYRFESIGRPRLKNVSTEVEVFVLTGFGQRLPQVSSEVASKERIAVLPFANISQDKTDEYFADGLTEELISTVSKTAGLRVIARTSVMKYKGTGKTISEVGRDLNVGNVLEGSVRKAGDKVRITIQLVETTKEEPRWSQVYDREIKDIFAIQSDIARQVAEALRVQVLGEVTKEAKSTVNPEAYIDYLRGRQAWNRRNQESLRQAIDFFHRSLKSDNTYAKAYTGLADSYASLALLEFMAPKEVYPKAKEAVGTALKLDPALAEAYTSLGLIKFQFDWDWTGAEDEFKEAIRLNPNYAPAHHFFADYLKAMGRFDEALEEISKAQELDPLNLAINTGVGHVLYLSREYDKAIGQYKKAVDLDPTFMATHLWFGRPYLEKGMYTEALQELETAVKLSGESTLALAMLGHGLAAAGRRDEAQTILEKLKERSKSQYVPSYWIAVIYNGFKDRKEVLAWLMRAFEERSSWLVWCNVEPRFDWLREDAEFKSLMKAMKFS